MSIGRLGAPRSGELLAPALTGTGAADTPSTLDAKPGHSGHSLEPPPVGSIGSASPGPPGRFAAAGTAGAVTRTLEHHRIVRTSETPA